MTATDVYQPTGARQAPQSPTHHLIALTICGFGPELDNLEKCATQPYNQAAKHQKSKAVDDLMHSIAMSKTSEDQDANTS